MLISFATRLDKGRVGFGIEKFVNLELVVKSFMCLQEDQGMKKTLKIELRRRLIEALQVQVNLKAPNMVSL
jgi:hypothetical protein